MTRDIQVVKDTLASSFSREVLRITREYERQGLKVEIQYATAEGKYDSVVYTAMIRVTDN